MTKSIIKFLIFFFLPIGAYAFSCGDVVGKTYLSPGDSDFQYHYSFKANGKVELAVYMVSHDDGMKEELKVDHFTGKYKTTEASLVLNIVVDKVAHEIEFSCLDHQQYMAVGPKDQTLKVKRTKPANHGFSMIDLWPVKSKVIRKNFSK